MQITSILFCDRVEVGERGSVNFIGVTDALQTPSLPRSGMLTVTFRVSMNALEATEKHSFRVVVQNPDMKHCGGSISYEFGPVANQIGGQISQHLSCEVGAEFESYGIYPVIVMIDESVATAVAAPLYVHRLE